MFTKSEQSKELVIVGLVSELDELWQNAMEGFERREKAAAALLGDEKVRYEEAIEAYKKLFGLSCLWDHNFFKDSQDDLFLEKYQGKQDFLLLDPLKAVERAKILRGQYARGYDLIRSLSS